MCAHYGLSVPVEDLQLYFPELPLPRAWAPQFNLSPADPVLVITPGQATPAARLMRWGLLPSWEKEFAAAKQKSVINARAETLFAKPMFAASARSRRCLLPASHFFEWQKEGKLRHPFMIHPPADELLLFAGLWNTWQGIPASVPLASVALITVPANSAMAPIHDRMPAILGPRAQSIWLDPSAPEAALTEVLKPAPEALLQYDPIASLRQL